MSIADKLNKLLNTKYAIKHAIINKGVDVPDNTKFADYPAKIDAIVAGSGGGEGGGADSHYKDLFDAITNDGTDYSYLFYYYLGTRLDVSKLNTSYVTDMSYAFYNCDNLISLDLSNFDTSKVTNMQYMFYGCNLLIELDISSFDTSKVTSMQSMFVSLNKLTELDVSHFNTSNVTRMDAMFQDNNKLTTLELSNFDTSNVTTMSAMFQNCDLLISLDLSNFDTSKVTNMSAMFYGCDSLMSLDMSNCDVSKCTSSTAFSTMFGSSSSNACVALVDFKAPKNIGQNISFQYCNNLSHDSLMSIINNLAKVTSTKTLTLGTTNLAKLTNDEKAIATNKGWTLK